MLSMVHTSNLDGYTIPAGEIVKLAHKYNALVLLDGAQSVPHKMINVNKLDVDFLAFSIHKMMGPSGMGVLYGKYNLLESLGRYNVGGDTISNTYLDKAPEYLSPPMKFEAGLQDYAGMIAAGAACDFLEKVGRGNIDKHEMELNEYITEKLEKHEEIHIIGPEDPEERSGICTFFIRKPTRLDDNEKMFDERLSDKYNIMIRSGMFCVNSWFNQKLKEGKINRIWFPAFRASFYLYNTKEEIDVFVNAIEEELERLKEVPIF
ncbi:MAG: aminotransferase class V-fold PLP-dependent enzyme [Proteobacteria bacterium]|nr:aminotransferase class V-fold PLP-dependent enzyme [Pseudomonadota bacterium]